MKIKGLIFDLDGVLVDTKKIHFDALNSALKSTNSEEITFKDHVNIYDGLPTLEKLRVLNKKKAIDSEELFHMTRDRAIVKVDLIE